MGKCEGFAKGCLSRGNVRGLRKGVYPGDLGQGKGLCRGISARSVCPGASTGVGRFPEV